VTFSDLKGTLTVFIEQIFGKQAKIRMRPSYFPFTEPSAEVDMSCFACDQKGCRLCKGSGWIEILGAGMVDPEVFKAAHIDPEKVSGFAIGMGLERIAMLKYGISDIRHFFENESRFLSQF
jgi:phenylalanyl-tRNA synthetase alpha chain